MFVFLINIVYLSSMLNVRIVSFLMKCFDLLNQKKIVNFFKLKFGNKIETFIDVGAHYGETICLFNNNFIINKFYAFEASPLNFSVLKKKKFKKNTSISIHNYAIGLYNGTIPFNQARESSSSTLVSINKNSKYYIRKNKVLNFFSSQAYFKTVNIEMISLSNFLLRNSINQVDILKIDTEGYDLNVIKSLEDRISIVKYIYFEHHFHDMLIKSYSLSDLHHYLISNNFRKVFKLKMYFRKTFEYIYENRSI